MTKKTDPEIARKVVELRLKAAPETSHRIDWKARTQAQSIAAPHLARPQFLAELKAQALEACDGDEEAAHVFLLPVTHKPKARRR